MPRSETEPDYGDVVYPESDGKPMADNLTQGRVIRTLVMGFDCLYADQPDVLVGGDFFWYPVEGDPKVVVAPDVLVVKGTPKVELRSYRQWEHGGFPVLAVEVLSHSNTWADMARKLAFYQRFGTQEYWVYDPLDGAFEVYLRDGDEFRPVVDPGAGYVSPVTGVRVCVEGTELVVTDPDGQHRWLTPTQEMQRASAQSARADEQSALAERLTVQANDAARRATEAEYETATLRAELARMRGDLT